MIAPPPPPTTRIAATPPTLERMGDMASQARSLADIGVLLAIQDQELLPEWTLWSALAGALERYGRDHDDDALSAVGWGMTTAVDAFIERAVVLGFALCATRERSVEGWPAWMAAAKTFLAASGSAFLDLRCWPTEQMEEALHAIESRPADPAARRRADERSIVRIERDLAAGTRIPMEGGAPC